MNKSTQRLKAKLKENPLYFPPDLPGKDVAGLERLKPVCARCVRAITGKPKPPKGWKKLPLFYITNYGNTWNRCQACGESYR